MEKIKCTDIVKAVGGSLVQGNPENDVAEISIDSRKIKPGSAFIAIRGERVDGHDYVREAMKAGCSAIICEKEVDCPKNNVAVIRVENTELALQDLAAWYLSQFKVRKIGITGSTGKTTTKEMLYQIMSKKYRTVCNKGNYNNLIGLPLSVFQIDRSTEAAIFEMGMDRLGEIHRLAEIVRPDVAVITNIGISHLSRLGSRENILKAKMEICSFLGKDGVLVLNCDDNMLSPYENKDHKVIKIKSDNGGDFNISNVKDMGEKGVSFRLQHMVEHCDFKIAVPGVHNIMNGSLAVGTAYCFGVDMKKAAAGLEKFTSTDKRLHIISGRGIKIIDDTYNASPDSMVAALNVLSAVKSNRKIAILGDMFELGEDEAKHHRLIGEYASQKGINVVISVGKNAELISLAAKERGMDAFHFDSKDMLIGVISQWVRRGDAILIKGSRGMAMDEIANHLKSLRIE